MCPGSRGIMLNQTVSNYASASESRSYVKSHARRMTLWTTRDKHCARWCASTINKTVGRLWIWVIDYSPNGPIAQGQQPELFNPSHLVDMVQTNMSNLKFHLKFRLISQLFIKLNKSWTNNLKGGPTIAPENPLVFVSSSHWTSRSPCRVLHPDRIASDRCYMSTAPTGSRPPWPHPRHPQNGRGARPSRGGSIGPGQEIFRNMSEPTDWWFSISWKIDVKSVWSSHIGRKKLCWKPPNKPPENLHHFEDAPGPLWSDPRHTTLFHPASGHGSLIGITGQQPKPWWTFIMA